jgi:CheY-like chemotaxis protein
VNLSVALGFLLKHGIRADTAESGADAIEKARAKRYDLLFMDHMMPGMDGIEAMAAIRALAGEWYKNLPIVALSANAIAGMRGFFLEAGMNDFLAKPIEAMELNRVLLTWLPPEKLQRDTSTVAAAPHPEYEVWLDSLLAELMKIDDLNVTAGLANTGGKDVYAHILRQFCRGLDGDIDALRSFAEAGNWKEYAIRVHSLKSTFTNMGERFLSDWSLQLEIASANGDSTRCRNETEDYCIEMKKFRVRLLRTALMEEPVGETAKNAIDAKTLAETLKALEKACQACDTDSIDTLTENLRHSTFREDVDARLPRLCAWAESFDYDEIFTQCGELLAEISPVSGT